MTVSERLQQIRFGGGDIAPDALKRVLLEDLEADNAADIYSHIDYLEKKCARLEKIVTYADEIVSQGIAIQALAGGE